MFGEGEREEVCTKTGGSEEDVLFCGGKECWRLTRGWVGWGRILNKVETCGGICPPLPPPPLLPPMQKARGVGKSGWEYLRVVMHKHENGRMVSVVIEGDSLAGHI